MPIDIKLLREDAGGNPELVRESQRRRFADVTLVDQVLEKDAEWRKSKYRLDSLAQRRNAVQKEVAVLRKSGQDATEKQSLIKSIGEDIKTAQTVVSGLEEEMAKLLPKIGNIVAKDVPTSNDEEKDNEIVSTFGECSSGEGLLHHHEVLYRIEGYEPERGVGVAGHRAYFLRDAGLLLNQALISYSLAFLRKRGYSVLQPPYFMNRDIMAGVAQLEQFDEELYRVTGDGIDDKYLIATSEQPLCGFHKGEWMNETELPLRYGGMSTCFRKEAGAHGKDTWGIFRVHQFDKIEQFCITEGSLEKSEVMHQEMLATAEAFLQSLGLPYRVVNIVSGELNNAAIKKYDVEAWFPAYAEYRELVSCSNCTDYQSRSMEIRSGMKKMGQAEKKYVHMLNSTLCACTRTLSCILENYQFDGGVRVPEVLVPFMGGMTVIDFKKELSKEKVEAKGATKGGLPVALNAAKASTEVKPTTSPPMPTGPGAEVAHLISVKGDKVRKLKSDNASKDVITAAVAELVALKRQYVEVTGNEWAAAGALQTKFKPKEKSKPKKDAVGMSGKSKKADKTGSGAVSKPITSPPPAVGAPSMLEPLLVGDAVDMAKLEQLLEKFSYVGGWTPSQRDQEVASKLTGAPDAASYPNTARWVAHIASFPIAERQAW